jgi:hypothetical protein
MYVKIDIPELTEYPRGFPDHWLNIIYTSNRPDTYQIHAITTTYVRLVEAAMAEYRRARPLVCTFWNDNDSLRLGAYHSATAYFEACITNMHRAVRCMIKIRSRTDVPAGLIPTA